MEGVQWAQWGVRRASFRPFVHNEQLPPCSTAATTCPPSPNTEGRVSIPRGIFDLASTLFPPGSRLMEGVAGDKCVEVPAGGRGGRAQEQHQNPEPFQKKCACVNVETSQRGVGRTERQCLSAVKPRETVEWTPCRAVETEQRGGLQVCGTGELLVVALGESANEFSGHASTTSN